MNPKELFDRYVLIDRDCTTWTTWELKRLPKRYNRRKRKRIIKILNERALRLVISNMVTECILEDINNGIIKNLYDETPEI